MIVKINGQQFDLTSMEIEGEFAKLPVKPPVEDKQPVRPPVEPPIDVPANVTVDVLGELNRSNAQQRRFRVDNGETRSLEFFVPGNTRATVIFWNFAPQNSSMSGIRIWVSEEPGGQPMAGKVQYVENGFIRRGDTIGTANPILGRGQERRGTPILTDEVYYLNVQCYQGSFIDTIMVIGGNL
jgi:ssDNA-binding replication factor A large subunit